MENNLEEAREFIKKGLEYLKQAQKEDGVFVHGRSTAETIEKTGSPSYVCNGVKEAIKIICENLIRYYMAQFDEHWMACPEYATPTQLDKFLKDFMKTVEKRI